MAEIIRFMGNNELGYSHVVCSECGGNSFSIETEDVDGIEKFKWIHCTNCGNSIAVNMTPVFGPKRKVP